MKDVTQRIGAYSLDYNPIDTNLGWKINRSSVGKDFAPAVAHPSDGDMGLVTMRFTPKARQGSGIKLVMQGVDYLRTFYDRKPNVVWRVLLGSS